MSLFKSINDIFKKKALKEELPDSWLDEEPGKKEQAEASSPPELSGNPARPEMHPAGAGAAKGDVSPRPEQPVPLSPAPAGEEGWEGKQVRVWQKGEAILDTYRVEDIKAGGMGCVYITWHPVWKMKVAVKSPNQKMLSDRNLFARVLREADAWTGLGLHPHIAYCYYTRPVDGIPNIFIEYVDGGNLRDWIRDTRCFDLKVGLDLAVQFCHGMEHAHGSGMVHRDIKPENILMTREGILKITDFGIVRTAEAEENNPPPGSEHQARQVKKQRLTGLVVMGTYEYMSPQQHEDPRSVDARDDIFSFGLCLYEMLCRNRPFKARYPFIARIDKEEPADPLKFRNDLPPQLAGLLRRCCSLEREERPSSFKEIRSQLVDIYRSIYNEDPPHARLNVTSLKADGLNNRGVSYLYLGRADEARRCWDEALLEDPQHLKASFNLGYMQWQKGGLGSDDYLIKMKELSGGKEKDPDYWRCLGWIYLEQGNIEAIEEIQHSSQRIDDEDFLQALNDPDRPEGRQAHAFEWHTGSVQSVAFSPDGRYVLSGEDNRTLRLWDVSSSEELMHFSYKDDGQSVRRELWPYNGHKGLVSSVCFSPDGHYALSGSDDEIVRLWDAASGVELRQFFGHTRAVKSMCFSPDSLYALTGSDDWTIILWDIYGGESLRELTGHGGVVRSVCFSPDGSYTLSGSYDGTVRLWDADRGIELRVFEGHTDGVNSVAFSPDGRLVLSGSEDKTLRLWDAASGKELKQFTGHTRSVKSVCFSPDGRYALSGSADHTVRLWDIASGKDVRQFSSHAGSVISVSFSPDGRCVLSGSEYKTVKVWEVFYPDKDWAGINPYPFVSRLRDVASLAGERDKAKELLKKAVVYMEEGLYREAYQSLRECQSLAEYERDKELLSVITMCGVEGKGRRVGLKGAWQLKNFTGHTEFVKSVCFSPDGSLALSGSNDLSARLWDVDSGKELIRLTGHKCVLESVCISPDGRCALTGSVDKTIKLWDISSGRELRQFTGHTDHIISICFSPDSRYALSGSVDKTVRLWDIRSGMELRRFIGHTKLVDAVCFIPGGNYILSKGYDETIRQWDMDSGKEVKEFNCYSSHVGAACFSRDCRYVLLGSRDNTFSLWDVSSGRELRQFTGHTGSVSSICFSPGGRFALSGGWDKTVRLWDVTRGKELRQFTGHTDKVSSVSFSPDGRYALSGGWDKIIKIWEFDWDWEF